MTKQSALDISDLRYLELGCPKCSTRVTLDAKDFAYAPDKCPSCSMPFHPEVVKGAVSEFMSAYRAMTHPDQKMKFRVIVDDPRQ